MKKVVVSEQSVSKKRAIYSMAERNRHIALWQSSGLSRCAYSASQGISKSAFSRWCKEALDKGQMSGFQRVQITASNASPLAKPSTLEIRLPNGIGLRGAGMDDMALIKRLYQCN